MTEWAAVGEAQRLDSGLRQAVDQDGRIGMGAQALDDVPGLGQVDRGRIAAMIGGGALGDQVARAQGADQDRLVRFFGRQAQVVRERGGDPQVDIAPGRLAAQEVGLHLQVAVAEQQDVPAVRLGAAQVVRAQGRGHRPIGICAFAFLPAELIQRLARIAPMQFGKLGGHGGRLRRGVLVGQHAALHQGREAARQGVGVDGHGRAQARQVPRHVARLGEPFHDAGHFRIDHQAQVRHGVNDQHAVFRQGRQVDVGRPANEHVDRSSVKDVAGKLRSVACLMVKMRRLSPVGFRQRR